MNKSSIIILHGWGLRGNLYKDLAKLLKNKNYNVYLPDLPGFGNEPLKSETMTMDDYVEFLKDFINENKILKPILIGHSFGGRVSIKYSWKYKNDISKLILTGVPIIRSISLFKRIIFLTASIGGKILNIFPLKVRNGLRKVLYFMVGEWDYYKAGKLKEVFKNVINDDLIKYIKEIRIPIILVWGQEDTITPVSNLKKIKKIIPNAKFLVVQDIGHNLPYRKPLEFYKEIITSI